MEVDRTAAIACRDSRLPRPQFKALSRAMQTQIFSTSRPISTLQPEMEMNLQWQILLKEIVKTNETLRTNSRPSLGNRTASHVSENRAFPTLQA